MIDHLPRRRTLRTLAALALGGAFPAAFAQQTPALANAAPMGSAAIGASSGDLDLGSTMRRLSDARAAAHELAQSLGARAPAASSRVLHLASEALVRARVNLTLPGGDPRVLAVIDFSLPSTEKRLWVFDLDSHALLFEELVAHGRNSGDKFSHTFSNRPESHMSSLGAYQAGKIYTGKNGYSLRLHGLEPGFNDLAFERAIVIHGAPYVSADMVRAQGRLGRSLGCPAVRTPIARPLINALANQAFLFNFYPQQDWMRKSALIGPSLA